MFFIRFISFFVVFDDLRLPDYAPDPDSPRRRAGLGAGAIAPSIGPIQHTLSHSQLTLVNSRLLTLTLAEDLLGTGLKRMHLLRGLAG